jgi:ribosomal protein L7Ae-like RNA K-turn-binding protein
VLQALGKAIDSGSELAYHVPVDYVDEYIRIGESTVIESLRKFVRAVCEGFGNKYLRAPNNNDTTRLLNIAEQCGFPSMFSIDCMH